MPRYINIDALGIGEANRDVFNDPAYADGWNSAIKVLRDAPIVDVALVRHAIWRYKIMTVPGGKGQTYAKWSCTHCKGKFKERSNYCPNCGADMREGEHDV